mgnify:CR=1 FL=1
MMILEIRKYQPGRVTPPHPTNKRIITMKNKRPGGECHNPKIHTIINGEYREIDIMETPIKLIDNTYYLYIDQTLYKCDDNFMLIFSEAKQ